ncbi:MAG TPA: SgcJ/EcaC family oxidoreductase [Leptospiraceae bacterium]|nr:SgcJ/EcaC family oxidoreductase [Leptospiraceae bacterium]HMW07730.1 SgcJ/EcaC family oxidoreductase [Leptospiraceae bacterium]HMX32000.1 SgcJ/EcaC family oxidoreductase [Leptospiraceae bacterium]HMY33396.1 SgcJ/EcaC family oxidoreductase [Leptospiraceae bacterium]HMZ64796.1 SgcJ/EcaC family oxidoreductase [Leptospiraceae bacterium]
MTQNNINLNDKENIRSLYEKWIFAWNHQNAKSMSDLVSEDGDIIGFDGSHMRGPNQVYDTISQIFAAHPTGLYVSIVQEIKLLSETTAILRAVVGMIPRGGSEINPAVNAIQSLIAVKKKEQWFIELFQNTPAAFHGRPEVAEQLTKDLRSALSEFNKN